MKTARILSYIVVLGITGIAISIPLTPNRVLAWHPVGMITKSVADETTNSASVDANTADTALNVKPGDTLRYTITITNNGQPNSSGMNDLASVQLTDMLPTGVTLVANPSERTISENIPGVIKPGDSVVRQYGVTVASTTNGDLIKNTACFTGNSTANDDKQQGCDTAYVKISVPASFVCSAFDQPVLVDSKPTYRFTAHATMSGNVTFENADFTFGDGTSTAGIIPSGNAVTTEHSYSAVATDITYPITATLHFSADGKAATATCQTSIKLSAATPPAATPAPSAMPAALPSTGPEFALGSLTGLSAIGYAGASYARSKRILGKAHKK